ncbi:putative Heavy metal sensor signal transduction histidine kinase [Candidatus Sulfopaludibacter sp. SbA3]|nr:putative Heavy metal sensor signal transduction histidine kinase [Candidatus Sulfopaludibacter sp. SbA3]
MPSAERRHEAHVHPAAPGCLVLRVLLFGLALFGFGMWYVLQLRLVAGLDHRLALRVAGIHTALAADADIDTVARLRQELAEFAGEVPDGTLVQLRAPSGALIQSSARQPVFSADFSEGTYHTVQADARSYRITVAPLDTAGERYQALVAVPLHEVEAVMQAFRALLFLMVPAVLIMASLGGYWLSSRALRPVDQITTAAASIGVRDLSRRICVPQTGDELQRMAEVWNAMLERLEASVQRIRQFTADASHELRTPLALIRTTAELALRRDGAPEDYRQSLRDINTEVAHMTELTESLLCLARSDAPGSGMTFVPTDLTGLVRSVLDEYARLATEKELRLSSGTNSHPVIAMVDGAAIRRLLLILLDNAVRHTPPGGAITISVLEQGHAAVLTVEDTGEGISCEVLPHIFERFYRADPARSGRSGFGLGLSIAQAIARAHGAEIAVVSTPGAGARFAVSVGR